MSNGQMCLWAAVLQALHYSMLKNAGNWAKRCPSHGGFSPHTSSEEFGFGAYLLCETTLLSLFYMYYLNICYKILRVGETKIGTDNLMHCGGLCWWFLLSIARFYLDWVKILKLACFEHLKAESEERKPTYMMVAEGRLPRTQNLPRITKCQLCCDMLSCPLELS